MNLCQNDALNEYVRAPSNHKFTFGLKSNVVSHRYRFAIHYRLLEL